MCSAARVAGTVLNVQPAAVAVFATPAAFAFDPPETRKTTARITATAIAPPVPASHGTGRRAVTGSCRSTRRFGAWTLRGGGGVRAFLATADYGIRRTFALRRR